jgi:subtilisin-like proprotein convertase family protein
MNQPQDIEGVFLDDDVIPDTLLELLNRMFKEQWPVLSNTVKRLDTWIDQNPHIAEIPRTIGEHNFTIGDTTHKRAIGTFHQWKVQRILDCYHQFDSKEQLLVDAFLQAVGGLDSMQLDIKKRVTRVNNKLVLCG